MKILTSVTYYYPYISGLTLHAQMIAETLAKKGNKVSVLCMQHDRKLVDREILHNVEVFRAKPILQISKGFISLDFVWKCFLEIPKHDVLVIHLPQFEGLISAFFAKLFNKKIVVFYHCDVVLYRGLLNKIIERVLYISNYFTLHLASVVLHSTEDFAVDSPVLKKYLKKIKYVYPPIKSYKASNRIKKLLINKIGKKQDFLIGIASRLSADKGIGYLLEAIPLLKFRVPTAKNRTKFKVVIVGPTDPVGETKYKSKILQLIGKYQENIVLLGKLQDKEMGSFYSLLDVLVLPSINSTESFGTVQVEAMMQGTPVIVSDLPGARIPVLRTGMGVIIPSRNTEKLAQGILEVLENKQKYIKDIKVIKQEFSFDKTIKVYERSFER